MKHKALYGLVLAALVFSSCSTKKNTFVSRNYHNLTSRYNGYFNARESVKEGVMQLEKTHKDDFTQILEIYPDGSETEAQSVFPQMDRAIKKCSHVIQRHSMVIKKEEHCKWIDDSYLLLGIAQFYKQDFHTALQTFDYVAKQYDKNEIKHEARLWLVRTYAELGRYEDGLLIIDMIKNDKAFPKSMQVDFETIYADFYLKQKVYPTAAMHLQKAISLTKKRKKRVRLIYIMAQLYQREGEYRKAGRLYEQVVSMNPPYEIAFNAKINRARTVGVDGDKVSATARGDIRKQLEKMLHDDKNIEYFDQIHYTLGELALREGNEAKALEHLELSIRSSQANPRQKGLSYLLTADIRFKQKSYELAQAYYDSSVAQLPREYEGYEAALNMKNSLAGLVKNLQTIEVEDSLQRLAAMDEAQRDAYIDDIMAEAIESEERKRFEEEERARRSRELITQGNIQQRKGTTPGSGGANWYFYNPTAMASGLAEFRTRWSDRPLEDNWRRSNKASFGSFAEGETKDTLTGGEARDLSVSNIRDKQAYLKNIPLTAEALAASHNRINEALYQLGIIYKERLMDNPEATETFIELNRRYPKGKYKAASCYYLYLMMKADGNESQAENYKRIILGEFPETEYALLLKNPNYVKDKKADQEESRVLYESTFEAYNKGRYETVFSNYQLADSLHKGNKYMPKFSFLQALSLGKTRGPDSLFVASLEKVAMMYSYDDAGMRAKQILDRIKPAAANKDTVAVKDSLAKASPYKYDAEEVHFVLIVVPSAKVNLVNFKKELSDFHQSNYSVDKLSISTVMLDDQRQIVVVKTFEGAEKAQGYHKHITEGFNPLVNIGPDLAPAFAISSSNYVPFYRNKDVEGYRKFFEEYYRIDRKIK